MLGERYIVTFRRHAAELIARMKRVYREDFRKFAQSPGFLLYEIADHLTETYRRALQGFAAAVEQAQLKLFGEIDDDIFRQVATLTQDILGLRKVVTAAREIFHELATRRSPFVSETTRPKLSEFIQLYLLRTQKITLKSALTLKFLQLTNKFVLHP